LFLLEQEVHVYGRILHLADICFV